MPRLIPLRLTFLIPLLLLAVAAVRGAFEEITPPPDTAVPRAVVFDVGQGDAILLDGPGLDAEVLVDGGTDADTLREDLHRALGRDRTLNLVVLTHPHLDHLAGLAEVLQRYAVDRVLLTGVVHTTRAYEEFLRVVRDHNVPTTVAIAGQSYDVGPFHLDVLAPLASLESTRVENLNSSSIVMMVSAVSQGNDKDRMSNDEFPPEADAPLEQMPKAEIRNSAFGLDSSFSTKGGSASGGDLRHSSFPRLLLTGDAESDVEVALLKRWCPPQEDPRAKLPIVSFARGSRDSCPALAADVLKVPHHGSQDSSSDAFLEAVAPQHAIVSAGAGNDYGHPHRRALKRLERTGARIWRTDEQGAITVEFSPEGLRVVGER